MKRRNGEGTIFKDKNGRWVAMAYVPRVDGSSKREYVASGKKYEVVKKKLDERLSQKSRFTPPSEKNWSVGEYLDYWLREIHAREIRHTTKTTYEVMIRKHIKPFLGNYKLRELSVFNLRCSLDAMEEQGRTARIRLECLRVLSVCLNYAMSEEGGELVSRNVAQLVKKPKYKNKEIVIWTAEQAAWFLRVAQNHPKYIAFLLILIYGIRRGEAIGLSWTDIDFEDNKVHIRQQLCRIDGKVVACDLKTDSSRRVLPLLPFVREALLAYAAKNGPAPPLCAISQAAATLGSSSEAGYPKTRRRPLRWCLPQQAPPPTPAPPTTPPACKQK